MVDSGNGKKRWYDHPAVELSFLALLVGIFVFCLLTLFFSLP